MTAKNIISMNGEIFVSEVVTSENGIGEQPLAPKTERQKIHKISS